jgi:hypothetical protein
MRAMNAVWRAGAGLREAASAARDKFSAYAASFTFCFNREASQRAAELAKLPHQVNPNALGQRLTRIFARKDRRALQRTTPYATS